MCVMFQSEKCLQQSIPLVQTGWMSGPIFLVLKFCKPLLESYLNIYRSRENKDTHIQEQIYTVIYFIILFPTQNSVTSEYFQNVCFTINNKHSNYDQHGKPLIK